MKKLFFSLSIAIFGLASCNMGEDGDSYLSISYFDPEHVEDLEYVDVYYEVRYEEEDGYYDERVYLPNDWVKYLGDYFYVDPGTYFVDYRCIVEEDGRNIHREYSNKIEIWRNEGRSKHRDGDDVYFDVVLYNRNKMDFTYDEVKRKSFDITDKEVVYTKSENKGDFEMRTTCYLVDEYAE